MEQLHRPADRVAGLGVVPALGGDQPAPRSLRHGLRAGDVGHAGVDRARARVVPAPAKGVHRRPDDRRGEGLRAARQCKPGAPAFFPASGVWDS